MKVLFNCFFDTTSANLQVIFGRSLPNACDLCVLSKNDRWKNLARSPVVSLLPISCHRSTASSTTKSDAFEQPKHNANLYTTVT